MAAWQRWHMSSIMGGYHWVRWLFLCPTMALYTCNYCLSTGESYSSISRKLLDRHIKICHSKDPGFRIECPYRHCSRVFANYRTYQNHLLTHKDDSDETSEIASVVSGHHQSTESVDIGSENEMEELELGCSHIDNEQR